MSSIYIIVFNILLSSILYYLAIKNTTNLTEKRVYYKNLILNLQVTIIALSILYLFLYFYNKKLYSKTINIYNTVVILLRILLTVLYYTFLPLQEFIILVVAKLLIFGVLFYIGLYKNKLEQLDSVPPAGSTISLVGKTNNDDKWIRENFPTIITIPETGEKIKMSRDEARELLQELKELY